MVELAVKGLAILVIVMAGLVVAWLVGKYEGRREGFTQKAHPEGLSDFLQDESFDNWERIHPEQVEGDKTWTLNSG